MQPMQPIDVGSDDDDGDDIPPATQPDNDE